MTNPVTPVTLHTLRRMKRDGRKIVGVVLYDFQMARLADRAGVDIVSVGDSVGVTLWGHSSESDLTLDQMILVCQGVRRGVSRAIVSCDVPLTPLRESTDHAVRAARRLAREGGADLVKVDVAASSTDVVRSIVSSGIPVWAQIEGPAYPDGATIQRLLDLARQLEAAGASLLDFRHSGPVAGPEVARGTTIPVIGGLGGGPWLDGRVRALPAAVGYLASAIDDGTDRYSNVAAATLTAIEALCDDVRAARPLRGEPRAVSKS